MAISFVAAGAIAVTITVTTQAITAPTLAANDIMIACLINRSGTANVISAPDGTWTEIIQGTTAGGVGNHQYAVFWKLASAGDSGASFTFTKATDDNVSFGGMISAWRGCVASPIDATPAGVTEAGADTENVSFPAFDPTETDVEVVFIAFYGDNGTTFAAAMSADTNPDCTIRWDLEDNTGQDFSIACTSGMNDGSNIAARTWASNSGTNANNAGVVFALVPVSWRITDSVVLKDTFLTNIQESLPVRTLGIPVSIADIFGTNIHSFPQSALADTTLSLADAAVTDIVKFVTLDVSDLLLLDADAVAISGVLLVNVNPVQMLYRPRMLVLLTIAAQLERYSTEDIDA